MPGTRVLRCTLALLLLLPGGCRKEAAPPERSDKPRDVILDYEMVIADGSQANSETVINVMMARLNEQDKLDVDFSAIGKMIEVRLPSDRVDDVKKLLTRPAGLELRVAVANPKSGLNNKLMVSREELKRLTGVLHKSGPDGIATASPFRWYPIADGVETQGMHALVTAEMDGRKYLLLGNTRKTSMRSNHAWRVVDARSVYDPYGKLAVEFQLDDKGSSLLGRLTSDHIEQNLAIVVGGEVYSAPIVRDRIEKRGQISGSFTQGDVDSMARCLMSDSPGCDLRLVAQRRVLFDNTGGLQELTDGSCISFDTKSKLKGEDVIRLVDETARKMNPPVAELFAGNLRLTIYEYADTGLLEVELCSSCIDEAALRAVVSAALGNHIDGRRKAIHFDGMNAHPDNAKIMEVNDSFMTQWSTTLDRETTESFTGGTAVLLESVSPAQTAKDLSQRLKQCLYEQHRWLDGTRVVVVNVGPTPAPNAASSRLMVLATPVDKQDIWSLILEAVEADEGIRLEIYSKN